MRFGESAVLSFNDPYLEDVVRKENDIFFIDIGPVWVNIESDCGDTLAIGDNPDHLRIKSDIRSIFDRVKDLWRQEKSTGVALYRLVQSEVERVAFLSLIKKAGRPFFKSFTNPYIF